VRAVINLAPTNHNNELLDGHQTIGFELIHGTADPDVSLEGRFRLYDESGSNLSQHPFAWNPSALYRSNKLIDGGNHEDFAESGTDVATLTKGYALSFFAAHLNDDVTWYELYTRGDSKPGGLANSVTTQYRDGFLRDVIDNCQRLVVSPNTLGGTVTSKFATIAINNLSTNVDTPHFTRAITISPTASGGFVSWAIPAGHRNTNDYKYLSLRIGQTSGDPVPDGVRVRIKNGAVWSGDVELTSHGTIAQVDSMCLTGIGFACTQIADQFHMGTIRVPLSEFGAHDDVNTVRVLFHDDASDVDFVIDDLEFSEYILKP
jgi:hypothetical protein